MNLTNAKVTLVQPQIYTAECFYTLRTCYVLSYQRKILEGNTSCRLQLIAPVDESLATESNPSLFYSCSAV